MSNSNFYKALDCGCTVYLDIEYNEDDSLKAVDMFVPEHCGPNCKVEEEYEATLDFVRRAIESKSDDAVDETDPYYN